MCRPLALRCWNITTCSRHPANWNWLMAVCGTRMKVLNNITSPLWTFYLSSIQGLFNLTWEFLLVTFRMLLTHFSNFHIKPRNWRGETLQKIIIKIRGIAKQWMKHCRWMVGRGNWSTWTSLLFGPLYSSLSPPSRVRPQKYLVNHLGTWSINPISNSFQSGEA